ncbi:UDP-N-acetylmuramate--L-alanine ligase [Arcobacter sp. FWKO B]|uniref:UDP-N-acetylmuramate--L-alanine ligase n=1 Tax=Arcobacter sp. FWKO B TaxID=2593672 RepID=UPI0018A5878F|nr:UDP-N-acetylmuramate--L-alanine ligase [Arcobacter sp. FWKO B]QOG12520.1 UDP-N-acetylmuramate--L-alanine ligase [Arcobacter sp. FWKO B]
MKVHFIGIGGIGLSAIARFLNFSGHSVSGSDMKESLITKKLVNEGIKVTVPHNSDTIDNQDIVIYSAAVKQNNCELQAAREKELKILSRKEALPLILSHSKNYCVAGAHGKSTTTAILTAILQSSALIGAESKEFDSNFRFVSEDLVSFEADESDGSFLNSNPYCAIVTNAEPEHMEFYKYDLEKFYGAYESFLKLAKIRVINAEDEFLSGLDLDAIRLYPSKDIKNLSFMLRKDEPYTKFELKDLGEFEVYGFGFHIALDASLAILAALNEVSLPTIKQNIKKYKGIKKRFDVLQKCDHFILIDDYAHHPTEVEATIKSVTMYQELSGIKESIAIWQPHKYSRTISNLEHFRRCFSGIDKLIILPVYSAGEEKQEIDFKSEFSFYNPIFATHIKTDNCKVEVYNNDVIIETLTHGIITGFGAGDITYQLRQQH